MGCRQAGHMRPASVEYTSPPLEGLLFMGGDPSSLSDLEIAGCKSTAAVHFSPSSWPIAVLWACKPG
jgi:hypothetical protein